MSKEERQDVHLSGGSNERQTEVLALLGELDALYQKAVHGMPARWKSHCILPPEHATRLHTIQDDESPPCHIVANALYPRHGKWLVAVHNAYPKLRDALTKGTVLTATAQKHLQSALLYCGGAMQYASHHCQNLEGDISAIRQQIELALSSVEKVED